MVGFAPQPNDLTPANPDTADLSWMVDPRSPLAPRDPSWTYGSILPMAEKDVNGQPTYKWAWPTSVRDTVQGALDLLRGARGETGGTITPEAENALLAYALRGLGRGDPNELGIFAGKGAKNPPPEGSPLWSIGADDLPRFEINDANARTYVPGPNQLAALRELPEGHGMMAPADMILQHPELFQQYPELAQWKVGYSNLPSGYSAVTLPEDKQILMHPWIRGQDLQPGAQFDTSGLRSQDDLTSTLLHEFQHAIQNKEGFSRGSNPAMAQKDLYELANNPGNPNLSTRDRQQLLEMAQYPYDAYKNAAGEVEARNVARRYTIQNDPRMNAQGRDAPLSAYGISPRSTEDVPRNKQFLYPQLQPVEHNPYAPPSPTNPHPVDYDPFGAQASVGPPMGKPMVGQPNRPLAPPKRPQPVPQQTPNPQFEELPPDYKWPWEK